MDRARRPTQSGWRAWSPDWPRKTARADDGTGMAQATLELARASRRDPLVAAEELGGESCPRPLLVQRFAHLAGASLTAVFILSQHDAGVRRLAGRAENDVAWRGCDAIGEGERSPPWESRT